MKVSIIGLGMVGKEILHYLLHFTPVKEITILDLDQAKAQAEINDFLDASVLGFQPNVVSISTGEYDDIKDSDFVIINVSIKQHSPDRDLLAKNNVATVIEIMNKVEYYTPESFVIVTTNPIDTIVYACQKYSKKIPKNKIIGTGTLIDSIRLKYYLSDFYSIHPDAIQGYVLGEHGSTCFIPWSLVSIACVHYKEYQMINNIQDSVDEEQALEHVINRGVSIFNARKYTDHAIGACVIRIMNAVWYNEQAILPVSTTVQDYYELNDIVMSVPTLINNKGMDRLVHIPLTPEEIQKYHATAYKVKTLQENV